MKRPIWNSMMIIVTLLTLGGCVEMTPSVSQDIHPGSMTYLLPQHIQELAGPWEYKDAVGQGMIILDAEGKGVYDWEDGRLETRSLENGKWIGVWIQEGNDREGGFELTFSEDASMAQGEWWYTRLGKDHDPLEPGGTFSMTRSSAIQLAQ